MSSASNYLENKVLDHTLRVTAYTQPSNLYLALFNNTSTNAAANLEANIITDEVAEASYARKAVTFAAAVDGESATSANVTFDAALTSWGSITHVAIMDALTTGNVLYWGEAAAAKTIDVGDIYQISTGNLTVSLN
jgi:hypothetical protein